MQLCTTKLFQVAMLILLKRKAHLYENVFHEKSFRERGVKGAITSSRFCQVFTLAQPEQNVAAC